MFLTSSTHVLDASAFLALVNREPGYQEVNQILDVACMSAVNFSEVTAKLAERGGTDREIKGIFKVFELPVIEFDHEQGLIAGLLRPETKSKGLSFGDRACLSLAIQKEIIVVTADKAWEDLSLGIEIQIIR